VGGSAGMKLLNNVFIEILKNMVVGKFQKAKPTFRTKFFDFHIFSCYRFHIYIIFFRPAAQDSKRIYSESNRLKTIACNFHGILLKFSIFIRCYKNVIEKNVEFLKNTAECGRSYPLGVHQGLWCLLQS
jgi:hypothetical protein